MRRCLALLGLLLLLSVPAAATPAPPVRIALAVDVPAARVGGAGGLTVKTPAGQVLLRASDTVRLDAAGGQVRVDGRSMGAEVLLVPPGGTIRTGDRSYRGHALALAGPKGLTLVNVAPLETYLTGVLGGEIPADWPRETQRALAVAARTYVLYQIGRTVDDDGKPRDPRFDVHPSVKDQMYLGLGGESAASRAAVGATRGEFLSLDGERPLKAYYSAWCGGHTADSEPVFSDRVPRLVGVPDPYCHGEPWAVEFDVATLRQKAAPGLGRVADVTVTGTDSSGRLVGVCLTDEAGKSVTVTGHSLRMRLGPSVMRSTKAAMTVVARSGGRPTRVRFRGVGWGHGVGLCQWGSADMGDAGLGYREILRHYYPKAQLLVLRGG